MPSCNGGSRKITTTVPLAFKLTCNQQYLQIVLSSECTGSKTYSRFRIYKWIWVASQIRQKPVSIERRLISCNIKYNFKWNQPYLSRVSNLSRGFLELYSESVSLSKKKNDKIQINFSVRACTFWIIDYCAL